MAYLLDTNLAIHMRDGDAVIVKPEQRVGDAWKRHFGG
jgi:hypothetical protein